jgi:hypothetical protein
VGFGSFGSGNGQFVEAERLTFYGDEIFISDWGNNRVQVFSTKGIQYLPIIGIG